LLQRKPNSLDFGKPFEQWKLPKGMRLLQRRLESECGPVRPGAGRCCRTVSEITMERKLPPRGCGSRPSRVHQDSAASEKLEMPTMHDECEKIAARCAKENVDYLGFLLQLCEQELLDREKRAADRRLKAARFPNYKTLEDFKFEAQPTINRLLIGELMRGIYIEKRESIIFIGHPGTGKPRPA
jgi:IstB-like ATP binding protein